MSTIRVRAATVVSPVLAVGSGSIEVGGARLGFWPSPRLFDGSIYLEARNPECSIEVGRGSTVGNGAVIISEGPGISIGAGCLIGPGVQIYDSDFHALNQSAREILPRTGRVTIGDRVFVGSNVIICKGVRIGDGAVIGAGSVVVADVAPCSVVAGSPCRVVGETGEVPEVDAPTSTSDLAGLSE